ncbi:ChrR family anti-sigma-E factor [Shewanella sp. A3A]|nr:ChrR family anti-sigma-E factor [Shewanella ferrihydritica]
MIKHHPSSALIAAHAAGELSTALSSAISAHCELCDQCQQLRRDAESELAFAIFAEPATPASTTIFAELCHNITELPTAAAEVAQTSRYVCINNRNYRLPSALQHAKLQPWQRFGPISRMRFELEQTDGVRMSLLHMAAGGQIPHHTHQGQEFTLVLAGSFADEDGHYQQGDIILRDRQHQHSPQSDEGCLCLTVVDAPLHFTKGLSQVLNLFGQSLY